MMANAAIPYRVEQVNTPVVESESGHDAQAFARVRRFYVGGAYNFSMWANGADDVVHIDGKKTFSFEVRSGLASVRNFPDRGELYSYICEMECV